MGNLAATALRNVQLYTNERHLVNLLQTSIRQVMEATAGRSDQYDGLVQSLLHVAEGLTRADAVCAIIQAEDDGESLVVLSGPLATSHRDPLVATAQRLLAELDPQDMPAMGSLPEFAFGETREFYAVADVTLNGNRAGIVTAFSDVSFTDDQVAFLRTIAEQIGVGVGNRQQSASLKRLLFELSNVNYVSETITSTFDQHLIFPPLAVRRVRR